MASFTRETLPALFEQLGRHTPRVVLLFGERYLCRHAAEQVESILLRSGGTVHQIDGDQEDVHATLAKLRSFSLLPGLQLYRVSDTRLFHSRQVAKTIWDRALKAHGEGREEAAGRALRSLLEAGGLDPRDADADIEGLSEGEWQQCFGFAKPSGDLGWTRPCLKASMVNDDARRRNAASTDAAEALTAALASGIPASNVLMLLADEVDKRKKLFKLLKDEQVVVDLSVETGAGAKAQKEQKTVLVDLVRQTLAEQGKTMTPTLIDLLLERVGFHPVAVVMELRKVMLSIGERRQIGRDDLDALVGRTRQEALFELTGAIGSRNIEQTLAIAERLQENGIHPLAVVATLRGHVRGLMICRALQERPGLGFHPAMTPAAFQQQCLPMLKQQEPWSKEFAGHPYALFQQYKTAAGCSLPLLTHWMHLLLAAELRLKGSPIAPATVLQHLLCAMLVPEALKGGPARPNRSCKIESAHYYTPKE